MEAGKEEVRLIHGVGGTMRGTHILGIQYQITQGHAIFQYKVPVSQTLCCEEVRGRPNLLSLVHSSLVGMYL